MTHVRQQIREAVAERLAGLSLTGDRVYASRVYSLRPDELPAIRVYALSEPVQLVSIQRMQERDLSLAVEIAARGDDMDDQLDAVAAQIEAAMETDRKLGGLVQNVILQSTEITLSGEGDRPIGFARLTYLTRYRVRQGAPETAL